MSVKAKARLMKAYDKLLGDSIYLGKRQPELNKELRDA